MAEQLTQLCSLIIEDLYGDFFARIFQELDQRGRLISNQLAQSCHLPLRQVKAGLSTLVQLRLVQHHTSVDGVSTYQANSQAAYSLLRVGKISELAHKHHGPVAATVIEELALLGFASTAQLEERLMSKLGSNEKQSTTALTDALRKLADDNFILRARQAQFQNRFEGRQDAERYLQSLGPPSTAKGKKAQVEIDDKVNDELEKRINPFISPDSFRPRHAMNGTGNDVSRMSDSVDDEIYLCVDFSKVVRSLRDRALSQKIGSVFGGISAKVMTAALKSIELESDPFRIRSTQAPIVFQNPLDMTKMIFDVNAVTPEGLPHHSPQPNGWHEHDFATNGAHTTTDLLHEDEICQHLAIICEGPSKFFHRDGLSGSWFIDKSKLSQTLRDEEVIRLMGERVGHPGMRLIRLLIDKGKLDEKTLQEIGLLGAKELRQTLANLQLMGFLELQEVPREPQRQPNRTIFLWFYDAERVCKVLLGELYKTMARLYQRLRLERETLASTLSKIERTDVQGSEAEMLAPGELLILQQWRKKEEWLLGEIERLDDSVALLRDL